jgi:hypothetical protein
MGELKGIRNRHISFDKRTVELVTEKGGDDILIRDGRCYLCDTWTRIFEFDTAAGEYGTIRVCKKCLDKIWSTYNAGKRAKR